MKFASVAHAFEKIEFISSRLEITGILAELFSKAEKEEIGNLMYLCQGSVAPKFKGVDIGMGEKLVESAIASAMGFSKREVEELYFKLGDLGLVSMELASQRKQRSLFSRELSINEVYSSMMKIATSGGSGSQDLKIKVLVDLLGNASPVEAKFLTRFPVGAMRLGVGDPTILDALSIRAAGDKSLRETIERAYNLRSDLGLVATILFEKGIEGLKGINVEAGVPLRPALGERLPSAQEIIKKLGKCAVEGKYDGLRCQLHKKGDEITLFSRKLENITSMFPEVVAAGKKLNAKELIIEGEALAFNPATEEFYPFQVTIQRKRKYGIEKMSEDLPLSLVVFDVILIDGTDCTVKPYSERRKIIESLIEENNTFKLSRQIITDSAEKINEFFEVCLEAGLEGVMAKDLSAQYTAGKRKFAWVKLKRSYKGELADTIDAVILGLFVGKGKKVKFGYSAFLCGVLDPEKDVFRTICKVSSGLSEEELIGINQLIKKDIVSVKPKEIESEIEPDAWVVPRYVFELTADEITVSPVHTCGRNTKSGYALRFPRIKGGLRFDKDPSSATTEKEVIDMYKMQSSVEVQD
ncbi:MAG: ATP-dependent DNA ligase [Candidatus Diapherotrites archaeon]|nr:ATP-dependent DNA ligase [Candidatus Diapherotrites archaeon]